MARYIAKRLGQFVLIMFIASILVFIMVRLSKSDPLAAILGGKQATPETVQALKIKFGLDRSYAEQYISWISGIFRGNLGMSFKYQSEINGLFASRLPITLGLVVFSSVIALVIAVPMGVLAAVKKNTLTDRLISTVSVFMAGCPPFLVAIIFIIILSRYFPSYPFTGSYSDLRGYLVRLAVPSVALAFTMIALACRITRSSMIEQMNAQYTQTGVAKGLSLSQLVWRHNFRNAVIPVLSVVSIQVGGLIVGAVLVENVFSLAGLGTLLIDSIKAGDYAVVQDITLFMVLIFMVISLIVDLLYAAIDPRIRLD